MKIRINKEVIKEFKPCEDGFENYLQHHADFDGDILEFLALENIPARDKVWLAVRVMPRFLTEVFAIDCALCAYAYAAAAATAYAYAADAAAAVAADASVAVAADASVAATTYAADAAAVAAAERERQLDAIAYLVKNHKEVTR